MENLAKAIISVMNDVAGIEKSLTVGTGNSSYKGVSDKDVKKIIGDSMAKHGLCIMPIEVTAKTQVDRWEEVDTYSNANPKPMKTKQSVFVEVETKYLLLHVSGESQVVSGYGHGVDSQDKSAGKATTYAMKNALLYTFMIPTGEIDDTDKTHSNDIQTPKKPVQVKEQSIDERVSNIIASKYIDLTDHTEGIAKITTAIGLNGYYTSLSNEDKANPAVVELLTKRREALNIPQKAK